MIPHGWNGRIETSEWVAVSVCECMAFSVCSCIALMHNHEYLLLPKSKGASRLMSRCAWHAQAHICGDAITGLAHDEASHCNSVTS